MLTRVGNSIFGECFDRSGLVARSVDEFVVDDLNARIIRRKQRDLVGNRLSICESRHILANARKAQHNVLAIRPSQLRLGLFPNHHDIRVGLLEQYPPRFLREAGVDAAAETLVGARHDDQALLALSFYRLGLGVLEDGVGRLAVGSGFRHCFLRSCELG